jgi:hypothetical protein
MINASKDLGYNYTQERPVFLGDQGNHQYRAKLQQLGTARNWIIKMTITDPVPLMIQNAIARGDVSSF